MMLAVIDNYDSFTYNLVQYFGELGVAPVVFRNDALTLEDLLAQRPARICISPGPGTPDDAGISQALLRALPEDVPVLGVCLGHQCLGAVHGAAVVRAERLMHGKTSLIKHNERGLFAGLPNPFLATRYHSLIVRRDTVPPELEITAETQEGEIMGLSHRHKPWHGVQFHPESILTVEGRQLLRNFLDLPAPG